MRPETLHLRQSSKSRKIRSSGLRLRARKQRLANMQMRLPRAKKRGDMPKRMIFGFLRRKRQQKRTLV